MSSDSTDKRPPYYPLTEEELIRLTRSLTPAEFKLYLYIKCLNPFGDRYVPLDSVRAMDLLNMGKSTFYRAIAGLQAKQLVDWMVGQSYARDLSSQNKLVPKMGLDSQKWDESPTNGNSVPKMGRESHEWELQSPKPLQGADSRTPQTIQTIQTIQTDQIERETDGLEFDPDYEKWIRARIARFPQEPAFLDQVVEVEKNKERNKRSYLKHLNQLERAKSSAAAAEAPKNLIESFPPTPEDTLNTQIARKRALWIASPRRRTSIQAWCESVGVICGEDGPQLPPSTGDQADAG